MLLGYRVAYREKSKPPSYTVVDDNLDPNTNEYYVANLQRTTFYVFDIVARTQLGWGLPATVEVYTIMNRRKFLYKIFLKIFLNLKLLSCWALLRKRHL